MGNNTTFLHYLKNLAITAVLCVLPASALAQYTDLVGSNLDGWTLYWGRYNSESTVSPYEWASDQGYEATIAKRMAALGHA